MPQPFHEVMLNLEDAVAAYIAAECGVPSNVEVITSAQELGGLDGDPDSEKQGLPTNHVLVICNRASNEYPNVDATEGIANKRASVTIKICTESVQSINVDGTLYRGRNFNGLVAGSVLDGLHRTDIVSCVNQYATNLHINQMDLPSCERDAQGQSFYYLITFDCSVNPTPDEA